MWLLCLYRFVFLLFTLEYHAIIILKLCINNLNKCEDREYINKLRCVKLNGGHSLKYFFYSICGAQCSWNLFRALSLLLQFSLTKKLGVHKITTRRAMLVYFFLLSYPQCPRWNGNTPYNSRRWKNLLSARHQSSAGNETRSRKCNFIRLPVGTENSYKNDLFFPSSFS